MLTRENEPNVRLSQAVEHARTIAWRREGKPVCECCGKRIDRVVSDHNHITMTRRGNVCYSCNAVIGYAEWMQRNPVKFKMIIEYLKQYDPTHTLL